MRNVDMRALYQQVLENEVDPKKRRGQMVTHAREPVKRLHQRATGFCEAGRLVLVQMKAWPRWREPPKVTRGFQKKCEIQSKRGL